MVIVTDWNALLPNCQIALLPIALLPNCLIALLPNCLIAYHKDVHSTSLLMIIQGEHLGTGAGTGTTRQANSTWKMRVQTSIYKSKSSQFTCRTQKWFFVILWWLSTQRAMGNGYNGNLLPPLLFGVSSLHLSFQSRPELRKGKMKIINQKISTSLLPTKVFYFNSEWKLWKDDLIFTCMFWLPLFLHVLKIVSYKTYMHWL